MIYLTSFTKSKELPDDVGCYSAAVYQPKGFSFRKAAWADIRDDEGWIRPRRFVNRPNPREAYREALLEHYRGRKQEVLDWIEELEGANIALLCWCPYEKAAQRQLKEWGSFICHLSVVGEFLSELGVPVWYDGDRRRMAVLEQK